MSQPVRVLQVTGSLNVGGAETMLVAATRELVNMGFTVDFLVFGPKEGILESEVTSLGCRVLRLAQPTSIGRVAFTRRLVDLLRRHGPFDVVHSHVNFASGLVLAAAERAGVPKRIAHSHSASDLRRGQLMRLYMARSRFLILKHATVFGACGDEAGQFMFGGRWDAHGVVIRNGISVEPLLSARNAPNDLRRELGVPADTLLVGSIGRLVDFKNHAFLIRMLEEGLRQGHHLVLVGDGALRNVLEARVERSGLTGRVSFLGLRRDVPQILCELDLVLMPSFHEGLPLALLESQAAGTPALVSSAITTEVDLGLGLVRFLSIDDPLLWERHIYGQIPARVGVAEIRRRFVEAGYDNVSSARHLAALYRGDR